VNLLIGLHSHRTTWWLSTILDTISSNVVLKSRVRLSARIVLLSFHSLAGTNPFPSVKLVEYS